MSAIDNEHPSVWRLTPEQSRAFLEALFNPPEPSEALKKAARRSREMFGEHQPKETRDEAV